MGNNIHRHPETSSDHTSDFCWYTYCTISITDVEVPYS